MSQLSVMVVVDIANMKQINDDYGSSAGNRILYKVAQQLLTYGDVQDFYRHGNKYLFLLPLDRYTYERVQLLNQWIRPSEKFENLVEYHLIFHIMDLPELDQITPEYVVAQLRSFSSPFAGSEWLRIVCADPSRSDAYQLFSIQQGLKNGEFIAFYQPQWNITTDGLVGVEALARWQDQTEHILRCPSDFLPIIAKYNIIDLLTEKILQCVVQFIQENKIQLNCLHISINVPGRMLVDGQFYNLLVRYTDLDPSIISKLSVEITEQDLIENFTRAKQELVKLKLLGVSCALDDFGTGYSGYEYLIELPFDALKIDGRFVQSIGEHEATHVVLQSMIASAQTLHMSVIAEWVETQAQVDLLQALGCSIIQGHFVGEALSPKELLNFLAK